MKKRLLSAALALAMVLTLLPVSAFAADTTYALGDIEDYQDDKGNTAAGKTVTQQPDTDYTRPNATLEIGKWYWTGPNVNGTVTIYEADSGFIVGTGKSGAWYPDVATYLKNKPGVLPSSITLLSAITVTERDSEYFPISFTVDLNGVSGFTLPDLSKAGSKGDAPMTTLKIQNRGAMTSVGNITTGRTDYSTKTAPGALNLTVDNATVGEINLKGRANTVTLQNRAKATTITMDGESVTSHDKDGTTPKTTAYAAQKVALSGGSSVGAVTITNADKSSVSVMDSTTAAISVTGNDGSINVDGNSTTGKITVSSRTGGSSALPSVTVGGGTVAGIERADTISTAKSKFTIQRSKNNINITGDIVTTNGDVTVNTANTGKITVDAGSLTVSGSNNVIGDVTLATSGATTLSITATTTNTSFTKIIGNNKLTISNWPTGRGNYYGVLELDNYAGAGGGVKGGTFAKDDFATEAGKAENLKWFDTTNLQFIVPVKDDATKVALYGKTELTQAISDIALTSAASAAAPIIVLGQGEDANKSILQLNFGGTPWVYIQYNATTGLRLPQRVNNTPITKWIVDNGTQPAGATTGTEYDPNQVEAIPAYGGKDNLILTSTNANASAVVTKIVNVTGASSMTVDNNDVKVRLVGNNIELSGAVTKGSGGYADIKVSLITDVISSGGTPVVMDVLINYDVDTKKATFSGIGTSLSDYGAIVSADKSELILNRGTGAKYTVSANLSVSAGNLDLYEPADKHNPIVATVGGKLSGWTPAAKKELTDKLELGYFEFLATGAKGENNRAMLEAINAAQATITNDGSVTTWVNNAKDYIWKNGYTQANGTVWSVKHKGNFKDFAAVASAEADYKKIDAAFNAAYIVPYLVVNVTDYNENGNMTATLTPYYRVDVSADKYNPDVFYTVQAGRALSALTGDMSAPIKVTFDKTFTLSDYMHQDGKYVYQNKGVDGAFTYNVNHAGATGLGTIEINGTVGPISMTSNIKNRQPAVSTAADGYTYDTLQAAIDDTVPGLTQPNLGNPNAEADKDSQVKETYDTISVSGNYKGSCDITMTGAARKVEVVAMGDLPIKTTNKDVDVQNPSGYTYYIQLKRDTTVQETPDTTVSVAKATGGSARVSNSKAKSGEKVTITLSPASGYASNGVTVRTAEGTAVAATGSGNSYSFTMPSNTKKVTVTPAFKKTEATGATVTVSNTSEGTATTNVGTNKVNAGTPVTVTTIPSTGRRTMGLYVTSNVGTTTATRTGVNSFVFNVPAGATNVVVTPRFDTNNGTYFEDVWSTEYYSAPVAWAVTRGITDGTSTYTFSPGSTCNRVQMVTFLWRAAGRPSTAGMVNPFYDVSPSMGSDFYNAILWANNKGITQGDGSANRFNPYGTITRAQAVTFLWRYAGKPAAASYSGFYDVPANEYYAQAVTWAVGKGITNGDGSTVRFNPNGACLRAQIVTFLYRQSTGVRA